MEKLIKEFLIDKKLIKPFFNEFIITGTPNGAINLNEIIKEFTEAQLEAAAKIQIELRLENTNLKEALQSAVNGLEWHKEENPLTFDKSDYEKLSEWKELLKA